MSAKKSKTERIVTELLTGLVLWPVAGWEVMIGIGVAHGSWWPQVPTIGYWPAMTVAALFGGAAWALTRPAKET